tara:strand:+ start:3213 stop:4160 length:948 start_codon:yes stop_codon:yes gene_type:complete
MKILICHRPGGAWGYITDGFVNAFRSKGYEVQRWDGDTDSWFLFKPDLYIGCSGHKQSIPDDNFAKIAIHVNPYGPFDLGPINESPGNIDWTVNKSPDAVFGYGQESDRNLWSYWLERHGIPWVPMPTAADKALFYCRELDNKQHDIVYLGGRWEYKAKTIDKFLLPVLQSSEFDCKVHGWGDWPDGVCSGFLAEDSAGSFLNSGKIGPCISEMHTHKYSIDIPERAFKVALSGSLVIHDPVPSLKNLFSSAIVAKNADDYFDLCKYYLEHDDERLEIVAQQQKEVLDNHTYHHRLSVLLATLGFDEESKEMLRS